MSDLALQYICGSNFWSKSIKFAGGENYWSNCLMSAQLSQCPDSRPGHVLKVILCTEDFPYHALIILICVPLCSKYAHIKWYLHYFIRCYTCFSTCSDWSIRVYQSLVTFSFTVLLHICFLPWSFMHCTIVHHVKHSFNCSDNQLCLLWSILLTTYYASNYTGIGLSSACTAIGMNV